MNNEKIKTFIQLHILLFVFSLFYLASKIASNKLPEEISLNSLLTVIKTNFWGIAIPGGCAFLALAIYAVFFQQILKKVKLTTAYANKAVGIFWAFLYAVFILYDPNAVLTWGKVIGFILIIAGIILINSEKTDDNVNNKKKEYTGEKVKT